jgi:hypothetical protein
MWINPVKYNYTKTLKTSGLSITDMILLLFMSSFYKNRRDFKAINIIHLLLVPLIHMNRK